MRRFALAVACVYAGAMVAAVKVTTGILNRLDEADRADQYVPYRVPV